MRWVYRVLVVALLAGGAFLGVLRWTSRPSGGEFVLEPNEPALEAFSRQKRYVPV